MDRFKYLEPGLAATIVQQEKEGGAFLKDLPDGEYVLQTKHTRYLLNKVGGETFMSGHDRWCPNPVKVRIDGSTYGGSCIKIGYIGIGMYLEFYDYNSGKMRLSSVICSFEPASAEPENPA